MQLRSGYIREVYSLTDQAAIQNRLIERNHPLAGEYVSEIMTVIYMPLLDETIQYNLIEPFGTVMVARNHQSLYGIFFPNRPIRTSSFVHPGGRMAVTDSIAATWSTSVAVTASWLSLNVGFSHTNTHSISDTQDITVREGYRAYVTAFALHRRVSFDIYQHLTSVGQITRVGNGRSYMPNGVRFEVVFGRV